MTFQSHFEMYHWNSGEFNKLHARAPSQEDSEPLQGPYVSSTIFPTTRAATINTVLRFTYLGGRSFVEINSTYSHTAVIGCCTQAALHLQSHFIAETGFLRT